MSWYEAAMLFFLVATVYSTIGFGGGSSYLALLSFSFLPFSSIRFLALLCNIIVVLYSISVQHKLLWPSWREMSTLIIISVPASFLTATISIQENQYYILLGVVLLLAGLFTFFQTYNPKHKKKVSWIWGMLLGGVIGALSGLVGIGGGIFLAPVLYAIRWGEARNIAMACSLFILVNSLAGIAGQLSIHSFQMEPTWLWGTIVAVLLGSILGNIWSSKGFNSLGLKRLTGILVLFVGVKILFNYW